jgi:hypothetical protein
MGSYLWTKSVNRSLRHWIDILGCLMLVSLFLGSAVAHQSKDSLITESF